MRKIILPRAVRLFQRTGPNSGLLGQTKMYAEAGVEIEVGPVETLTYDHMDKSVVSVKCSKCPETHYILVEETGLSLSLTN
jgi:hypothetical protein